MRQDQLGIPTALAADLDRKGHEFLAEFLRAHVRRHPRNLDALAELGHALTKLGRLDEGLEVDRQLVRLVPDNPTVHYNLACSLALLNRKDDSLDALEAAVDLGYADTAFLLADDDLVVLRGELRFERLLRRLEAGAPAR
ncbi:MAG: tetratricopeptide repeat protein [Planctomycetes bacterium]|nr:tetratricopeptide repeat protein [Planctomycetota bacterium]MCB9905251.1 tetratricopeptide repeat protein [Planctomycetota bacterium]